MTPQQNKGIEEDNWKDYPDDRPFTPTAEWREQIKQDFAQFNHLGSLVKIEDWFLDRFDKELEGIKGEIRESAEPYDGAKWLNNIDFKTVERIIDKRLK